MRVVFKDNVPADMERLANGVDDSGFSVNHLYAPYVFDDLPVREGDYITFGGTVLSFVRTGTKTLRGETLLRFIGEDFLPKSELDGCLTCGAIAMLKKRESALSRSCEEAEGRWDPSEYPPGG